MVDDQNRIKYSNTMQTHDYRITETNYGINKITIYFNEAFH